MSHHISIDIEAASTKGNAAITQIGVAVMNHEGTILDDLGRSFKVDITDYDKLPEFDVNIGTMLWWAQNPPDTLKEAFGVHNPAGVSGVNEDRQSLLETLMALGFHLHEIKGKMKIWAKPPSFDLAIIQNACNHFDLQVPWYWRDERCLRTLLSMTPKDASIHGMPFEGAKHDAYTDAVHQLKQIRACLQASGRIR